MGTKFVTILQTCDKCRKKYSPVTQETECPHNRKGIEKICRNCNDYLPWQEVCFRTDRKKLPSDKCDFSASDIKSMSNFEKIKETQNRLRGLPKNAHRRRIKGVQ